jgi:serine/threonine protein kinase
MAGSGEFSAHPTEDAKYSSSSAETPALDSQSGFRYGQVFADKYELLDVIGSGAMGIIYRARHLILDKVVAIKVLHTTQADPALIMRFQREARAASSLNHPNVITVYDFGVHVESAPYMVMDYLQGRTLAQYIEERGQLSLRDTLDIVEQILAALAHAQKKNILHRDLKPSNIMVLEEDSEPRLVKLLDFGLAKLLDRDDQVALSAVGSALGSPAYMSPEQATGLKVDCRSDLYSLGCMMYEMIAGQPPLLGDSPMETLVNRLNQKAPPLRETILKTKSARDFNALTDVPTIVELFVAKLLERDQRDRFQTAQDARNYLNTIWEYVDPVEASEASLRAAKKTSSRATVKDINVADISRAAQSRGINSSTSNERIPSQADRKNSVSSEKNSSTSLELERLCSTSSQNLLQVTSSGGHKTVRPRTTAQGLRKIQRDKSVSVQKQDNGKSVSRLADLDLVGEFERFANRLIDTAQQFRRSNPGLYYAAIGLAVVALFVVLLILR